jgi:hypothetical protein
MVLPDVVIHADWGTDPAKRVAALARLRDGRYQVEAPRQVGQAGSPRERLGLEDTGRALVGFDFPIGVPAGYAQRAGIGSFRDALTHFGSDEWRDFYDVCAIPAEIGLHRPFFPYSCPRKGMCTREDLTSALGMTWNELHRRCERRTDTRAAASPLFWTLGGKQVGKGAISGWREFVQPMVSDGSGVALWPFDGSLLDLLRSHSCVMVETYPAEFYGHLGVRFPGGKGGGKRSQQARIDVADQLVAAAERIDAELDAAAAQAIAGGFGPRGDGEDAFGAMIGLLGMLEHLHVGARVEAPTDRAVRAVEGWIVGQSPDAREPPDTGPSEGPS